MIKEANDQSDSSMLRSLNEVIGSIVVNIMVAVVSP